MNRINNESDSQYPPTSFQPRLVSLQYNVPTMNPLVKKSLLFFAIISTLAVLATQQSHGQATTGRFSKSQNSLELANGKSVTIARYQRGIELKSKTESDTLFRQPSTTHRYFGIFHDKQNPNHFLALGQVSYRNTGLALHLYKNQTDSPELLIRIHERLGPSRLSFCQTENGDIFILSQQGVVYCLRDKKHVDRIAFDGFYQEPKKMFAKIQAVASNNRVYFYSFVDPDHEGKALHDVIVYEDSQFKKIDLGGAKLTSIGKLAENELEFVTDQGTLTIDLAKNKVSKSIVLPPVSDGQTLIPVKLFESKKGLKLGIWRMPRGRSFKDGYQTQVAEIKADKWVLSGVGVDKKKSDWKNVFGEDEQGRHWISGTKNGRLIVRHPDARYQAIEKVNSLYRQEVKDISFDRSGEITFHFQGKKPLVRLTMSELTNPQPKSFPRWQKLATVTPFIPDQESNHYAITSADGGKLVKVTHGDIHTKSSTRVSQIELPPEEKLARTGLYLTTDTDGNVWIFADKQNKTAVYENGEWQIFESTESTITSRHKAFQARGEKIGDRTDYMIGDRRYFHVHFDTGKHILFKNQTGRVAYFDGKNWHSPNDGRETWRVTKASIKNVFFHDNKVWMKVGANKYYSLARKQFGDTRSRSRRRWQKQPAPDTAKEFKVIQAMNKRKNWSPKKPAPVSGRGYPSGNAQLSFNAKQLSVAIQGQAWSTISLDDSPLAGSPQLRFQDLGGGMFVLSNRIDKYLYTPDKVVVEIPEPNLGIVKEPGDKLKLNFTTQPANQKVHFKYRFANDPWSDWQSPDAPAIIRGIAKKGTYSLDVQFSFDEHLLPAQSVTYEFTTDYSMQEKIDAQVANLSSRVFDERESAMKNLMEFGPAALPTIQELAEGSNVELKVRAKKILKTILKKMNADK